MRDHKISGDRAEHREGPDKWLWAGVNRCLSWSFELPYLMRWRLCYNTISVRRRCNVYGTGMRGYLVLSRRVVAVVGDKQAPQPHSRVSDRVRHRRFRHESRPCVILTLATRAAARVRTSYYPCLRSQPTVIVQQIHEY